MYVHWKRFADKDKAIKEAARLRRAGKKAQVNTLSPHNHDVFVELNTHIRPPHKLQGLTWKSPSA